MSLTSDQKFFYCNLSEYLDDDLSTTDKTKFEKILKSDNNEGLLKAFQDKRGYLQLFLQGFALNEAKIEELHSLVQDRGEQTQSEIEELDKLEKKIKLKSNLKNVFFITCVIALAIVLYVNLAGEKEEEFKPLEYLAYEALALKDDPEGRLNYKIDSTNVNAGFADAQQFINNLPGLGFKVKVLRELKDDFIVDGISVIDYDIKKIVLVQYHDKLTNTPLFYFSFSGTMLELPDNNKTFKIGSDFEYKTYTSADFNFLAWQQNDDVVSLLVGNVDGSNLIDLARSSLQ